MTKTKSSLLVIGLLLIALVGGYLLWHWWVNNSWKAEETPVFLTQTNVEQIDFPAAYKKLESELQLNPDTRIENVELRVTQDGQLQQIEFGLAEHEQNAYLARSYSQCFSCTGERSMRFSEVRATQWAQYPRLIRAETLFTRLQQLDWPTLAAHFPGATEWSIHTNGWNQGIALQADYFHLEADGTLTSLPAEGVHGGFSLILQPYDGSRRQMVVMLDA
ncbi:MAG TPA: hypothetical protein VFV52_11965 [Bacilli bacterium]|nr:hypothetical protein [Bacilli bacterium]